MHDPREAAADADAVYTDVWASMGQEAEERSRSLVFSRYQVDERRWRPPCPTRSCMHCLPAHRGTEITRRGPRRPAVGRVAAGRKPAARAEGSARSTCCGDRPVTGELGRGQPGFPLTEGGPAGAVTKSAHPDALLRRPVHSQSGARPTSSTGSGLSVTQATLSRDLAELGAFKVRGADGGWSTRSPHRRRNGSSASGAAAGPLLARRLERAAPLRRGRRRHGRAAHPARRRAPARVRIDGAELPEVAGTLAGDDTVLLVCRTCDADAEARSRAIRSQPLWRLACSATAQRHRLSTYRSAGTDTVPLRPQAIAGSFVVTAVNSPSPSPNAHPAICRAAASCWRTREALTLLSPSAGSPRPPAPRSSPSPSTSARAAKTSRPSASARSPAAPSSRSSSMPARSSPATSSARPCTPTRSTWTAIRWCRRCPGR